MASVDVIILAAVMSIEFVVGIALNMHILIVYMGNLKNGVSLGSSDKVHLTKALVNISLHVVITAECMIYIFSPYLFFTNEVFLSILMIVASLVFFSYWLTALLCVFYCTNITTCAHHIFIFLKRNLSSYLIHIILLSGFGSVVICMPTFWFCSIKLPGNFTYQSIALHGIFFQDNTYNIASAILGCYLPFAIAFVSTAFTSWSLISHMFRMKQNNSGFAWSKFQAQINATRTMILFLLISLIYSAIQMFFISSLSSTSNLVLISTWIVVISYPISEAVIIIQSSFKLRNDLAGKIFHRKGKNCETET